MNEANNESLLDAFSRLSEKQKTDIMRHFGEKHGSHTHGKCWINFLKEALKRNAYWNAVDQSSVSHSKRYNP